MFIIQIRNAAHLERRNKFPVHENKNATLQARTKHVRIIAFDVPRMQNKFDKGYIVTMCFNLSINDSVKSKVLSS